MNPADFVKSFSDYWTTQGQAMLKTQEQATRAMAEGMHALATGTMPESGEMSAGAAELARAGQAMMELWSAASAMSGELANKLGVPVEAGSGDGTVASVFGRITDPRQWMAGTGEMDDVLGRMAEGPRLADLWEIERHYARVMKAWMTVRQSSLEHNAVMLKGWLEAGRQFATEMAGRTGVQAGERDAKATLKVWTDVANRHLLETQRSETFLKTQRGMIRASTELRLAQQELVEHFGKQYGFPTRTELDDVHRTVTEMRRELRMMRRAMRMQAATPASGSDAVSSVANASPTPLSNEPARAAVPARRSETRKREVHQ